MATIYEVAKGAGVSTATVSRVLSRPDVVAPSMRRKVMQAVERLGFTPNAISKSLRTLRTGKLIVTVPDIANPFFSLILKGIEDAALREGYDVLVGDTQHEEEREERYAEMLKRKEADGLIMGRVNIVSVSLLCVVLGGITAPVSAQSKTPRPGSTVDDIRHELLRLPYYGVFDFLSFKYDKGTVDLMGYAYRPTLKSDAERAVKRVAGVDVVNDQVEELPVSMNDDNLRWQAYYAIYRDPFLSRYAPGGGLLWGHRHPFASGALFPLGPSRFPGTEPAGDYPIHIIVKQGQITLLGVVDNESDKTIAGMRARGVPGSFGVDNALMIDHLTSSSSATR